jgi:hypothetical protein
MFRVSGERGGRLHSFRMQMQAGTESVIWFGGNSWYGKCYDDFVLERKGGWRDRTCSSEMMPIKLPFI